eukprot:Opistho-2@6320
MVARDQLITLLRPKQHSLHPADLHLVFNLVHASSSFTAGESWTPLCLPRFNSKGFLHAHVSYLDNDNIVCLLLICTNKDAFFEMSTARGEIAAVGVVFLMSCCWFSSDDLKLTAPWMLNCRIWRLVGRLPLSRNHWHARTTE